MKKGLLVILLASSCPLIAADLTWTGATNADYNDSGNWGGVAPTAADTATFYAPGAGNLSMGVTATTSEVGSLIFGDDADSNVALDLGLNILYLVNNISVTAGSTGSHSIIGSTFTGSTDSGLLLGLPSDVAGNYTHSILNNSGETFTIASNISGSSAPEVNIIRELQIGGSGNIVITGTFFDSGILVSHGTSLASTATSTVISLNKVGTGTLTLNAIDNQYSGSTRISAGTIVATNLDGFAEGVPSSIGDSTTDSTNTMPKFILSGGTLRYIGATSVTNRTLLLGTGTSAIIADGTGPLMMQVAQPVKYEGSGDRTLIFGGGGSGTNTFRPVIANSPLGGITSVIKTGTGTWYLYGSNTFTGTLSVLGGNLEFQLPNNLGPNASPMFIDTGTLRFTGIVNRSIGPTAHPTTIGAGGATVDVSTPTLTLTLSQTTTGVGSLTKIGSGTLILSGSKGYSGGTVVKAGALSVGADNSLGGGAVTMDGGMLQFAISNTVPTIVTSARNYIINSAATFNTSLTGGSWTITGLLSGTGNLTSTGVDTLGLDAANSYSGNLTVASGTVRLGHVDALQNSTAIVNVANGLTFGTPGATYTLGGLSGTSGFAVASTDSGAIALQVGNNNSSNTYSGTLSGLGSLIKVGTGTQTLSGANTYSGSTAVTDGTLLIAGDINSASAISVGNGGKISTGVGVVLENEVTVAAGGRIGGNGTYSDATGITLGSGAIATPGNSAGNTTYETDLSFQNGAIYQWELTAYDENPGVTSDLITISGASNMLTFEDGSLISLNFIGIVDPDGVDNFWFEDHSWKIVDAFDGGTYLDLGLDIQGGGAYANGAFSIGTDGQDVYLNYAAIPEPSTMALMGLGLTGLFFLRRRMAGA